MMLFSFHEAFHELGARYQREQIFPCAVLCSDIWGQLSVVKAGRTEILWGVLCPRHGHTGLKLWLDPALPLDLHSQALLVLPLQFPPALSKGSQDSSNPDKTNNGNFPGSWA